MEVDATMATAFVFPGQGSQSPGMGRELLARSAPARSLARTVERVAGREVTGPLVDGDADLAHDTIATQLGVFTLSVALADELARLGVRPAAVAGHSLGELSALVAGGWLPVEAGAAFVARRAVAMQRCCDEGGSMTAVVGVAPTQVEQLVAGTPGTWVANRNSPRQVIISGEDDAVSRLSEDTAGLDGGNVIPLDVAGAFHSPLMAPAQRELADAARALPLRRGHAALVSSVTGAFVTDVGAYREALARQVTAPVEWLGAVESLRDLHPLVVEVGPGRVLRGLIRHVDRRMPVLPCATPDECRAVAAQVQEQAPAA
jgi:[acyl-carrier-protein] S-malonyltransferase